MSATTRPVEPMNLFLEIIVSFLAPMFLPAAGGDLEFARLAALGAINAYRGETQADLLCIAQIVAFRLASIDSAVLSMNEDLSNTMIVRLRGNATSCARAADQAQQALAAAHPVQPQTEDPPPREAAAAHPVAKQDTARVTREDTAATEANVAAWATAATTLAAKLSTLSPDQQPFANLHAAALQECVQTLASGAVPPDALTLINARPAFAIS